MNDEKNLKVLEPECIRVGIQEDLLVKLRGLYMDYMGLIGCDWGRFISVPPDYQLVTMVLSEWCENIASHCRRLHEIELAANNGGRTPYMFDDSGNEYYTTVDGIRHYTRVEG